MKTSIKNLMSVGMVLALAFPPPVYGLEATQAAQDHLALAVSYDDKVTLQDNLIAEHIKMKKDYNEKFFVNEKVTPMKTLQEMEKHCNKIIESADKEKMQLLEFAKWHRLRAAELQGL